MIRIISLLILCLPLLTSAQKDLKWGKLSQAEKELTEVEFDKEADAVVLNEQGAGYFDFVNRKPLYYQSNHIRIKILKESGLSQADVRLRFSKETDVSKIKAQTILPNGKTVRLRKRDIFEEDYDEDTKFITFSFPQAKVGAVLEYRYVVSKSYIFNLPTWYFQKDLPVIYSQLQVDLPPYFGYVHIHNQGHNVHSLPQQNLHDNRLNTKVTRYTFYAENLPGVRAEDYITTISDYYTYIRFQLNTVEYPNQPTEKVLSTWDKLADKIREFPEIGIQIRKDRKINRIVDVILPQLDSLQTSKQKVHQLYKLLNQQMKWNEEYSIATSDDLEDVYEDKVGNSADLNLMFIALLRQMDIEANPVFISTRSNGAPLVLYPIITQFNHVLALVKVGEAYEYYDLSEKFRPYNCVRYDALNRKGWLVTDDDQNWVNIPALKGSDVIMVKVDLHPEEQKMSGTLQGKYTNYNSIPERKMHFENSDGEHWKERFSSSFSSVEVVEIQNENLDQLDEDFKEIVYLEMEGGMTIIDSFMYFKPITYTNYDENRFKLENRHCPVDFGFPFNETMIYNYKIPEAYTVEYLPENIIVKLEGESGQYKYLASYDENRKILQILSQLDINSVTYRPEQYKSLKNFFVMVKQKLEEQIVLKKI